MLHARDAAVLSPLARIGPRHIVPVVIDRRLATATTPLRPCPTHAREVFPRNPERESFQRLQQTEAAGAVAAQCNLCPASLLDDPSAQFARCALLEIKLANQILKHFLIGVNVIAKVDKKSFQSLAG